MPPVSIPSASSTLTRRQGLLSDDVRALYQDRNGSLWIGSRRGLSRLSESNIRAVLNRGAADGFVAAVTVARDGAVWTATATGLTRRRGTAERTYTERDGLPGRIVTALHEDRLGTLWAATTLGVARLVGQRFVPLSTPAGAFWSGYQIRSITSQSNGALWLCDQERGLFRWQDGTVDRLVDVVGARKAYVVHADRTDRVWIGFWGGGLSVYDRGHVSSYAAEQGLPQASVNDIFEDRSGRLWLVTEHEVALVDGERIRTFKSNGFPQAGVVSMLEDGAGDFWIGLGPALMRIDPGEFEQGRHRPRPSAALSIVRRRGRIARNGRPARCAKFGANTERRTAVRHVGRPRGRRSAQTSRSSAAHADSG